MNPQTTTEEQTLQTRFSELPPDIMGIITGGTLDATMLDLKESYELSDDQVRLIENEIILVLSFFSERTDFLTNMQSETHIDETIAQAIAADVDTEIFELVEDYFDVVSEARKKVAAGTPKTEAEKILTKKASLAALADSFEKRVPLAPITSTSEVGAEMHEPLTSVEPLRTMQGDIKKIHGYGAFNDAKEKGEVT